MQLLVVSAGDDQVIHFKIPLYSLFKINSVYKIKKPPRL